MNSTIILKKMLKLYEIWNSVYEKKINNNSIEILNQDYQKNLQYSLIQDNAVNSFKKILKYLNPYEKQIMKNIVICKNIMEKIKFLENMDNIENRENDVQLKYNLVELRVLESSMKQINPLIINNKKLKLLLPFYIKYQKKIIPRFYLSSIFKLDKQTIINLNKLYKKIRPSPKCVYTLEEIKIKNKKRRERRIIQLGGYENYKNYCRLMYKKWYHNLTPKKKKFIQEKRKYRYQMLPEEIKQKYKENKMNKLDKHTQKELYKKYWLKKKEKFKELPIEIQKKYKEALRIKKKEYYHSIPLKKKMLNRIRTYQRQLHANKISINEFFKIKMKIIDEYKTKQNLFNSSNFNT